MLFPAAAAVVAAPVLQLALAPAVTLAAAAVDAVHTAGVVAPPPAAATAAIAASAMVGDNIHSPYCTYPMCTPLHSSILVDPSMSCSASALSAAAIAASATVGGTECSAP